MDYGKAFRQYKRSSIETAGKLELIIMCYDKTILCLNQAKDHLREGEIPKKVAKLQNALDIIAELQSSLNFEKGGEIAKCLDSLYSYLTKRIILADIQKDYNIFDECIGILSELKSAWEGISSPKEEPVILDNNPSMEIRRLTHQIAA
jgi:flagellar secretion chaperone FliS